MGSVPRAEVQAVPSASVEGQRGLVWVGFAVGLAALMVEFLAWQREAGVW